MGGGWDWGGTYLLSVVDLDADGGRVWVAGGIGAGHTFCPWWILMLTGGGCGWRVGLGRDIPSVRGGS